MIFRFKHLIPRLLFLTFYALEITFGLLSVQENKFRNVKTFDGRWKFRLAPKDNPNIGFTNNWYSADAWPILYSSSCTRDTDSLKTIWMPIPSSYNDITQDINIRDHVGWVWYQTEIFQIPEFWKASSGAIYLHFGSVNYYAIIWVNGQKVGEHEGGHVPFHFDVTHHLSQLGGQEDGHVITVAVNNTLTHDTIPPADYDQLGGDGTYYPRGYARQTLLFDFFNYAGIHRSVHLYHVKSAFHIADITVETTLNPGFGFGSLQNGQPLQVANVTFDIKLQGPKNFTSPTTTLASYGCKVDIRSYVVNRHQSNSTVTMSPKQVVVARLAMGCHDGTCRGSVQISNPELWWPIDMSPIVGFQYEAYIQLISTTTNQSAEIATNSLNNVESNRLLSDDVTLIDGYVQKFGIRSIVIGPSSGRIHSNNQSDVAAADGASIYVNGRPFYFRGTGWHEDHVTRGRGFDWALTLRDFHALTWLGVNSFRTSHYPYAEEIMDLCDEMGIVVINECPGVGLRFFNEGTLALHRRMLEELISRDKNRPSTFLWSVANEPRSGFKSSSPYFKDVVAHVRQLDPSRYVTAALYEQPDVDLIGQYMDVICINRYYGWYQDTGHLEFIRMQMTRDLRLTWSKYRKPIIVTEYGSETIPGIHSDPPTVFSEEYQVQLIQKFHAAFDLFRTIVSSPIDGDRDPASNTCLPPDRGTDHVMMPRALSGEMIWNFADFQTPQTISRAFGNRKGVFTREGRYPKSAAFTLKKRYDSLKHTP